MAHMVPLYDRLGTPTAFFIEAEERFVSLGGAPAAWLLLSEHVYNYRGAHVAWWRGDRMLGDDGGLMLWAEGARVAVPLPRPFKQFTIPQPGRNPGHGFFYTPPDAPSIEAGWSATMFGVW